MKLEQSIGAVKGIGKIQAKRLNEIGIMSIADLLWHLPFRYEDMRSELDVTRLKRGELGTITGVVGQISSRKTRAGQMLIEAIVKSESGEVPLAWFGNKYILSSLAQGQTYRFSGKISEDWPRGGAMVNPAHELSSLPKVQTARMLPVYELTAGITVKMMRRYVMNALRLSETLPEVLPAGVVAARAFPARNEAFRMIHDPSSQEEVERAKARFGFEEMYFTQLASAYRKRERDSARASKVPFNEQAVKDFVARLPFTLTNAQRRAAWTIIQDMQSERPMQRLLNGDVGAGKTAVAAIAAFNVAVQGEQAALLAPTEILARQHFETLKRLYAHEPKVQIALLTRVARELACAGDSESVPKKEFDSILKTGMVNVVVGTHALLEDWVELPHMVLAIVDEQHRFGVKQREKLKTLRLDGREPHFLSMTATPIPRSLALIFYGDLDVSVLDEMPPGRTPVSTFVMERRKAHADLGKRLALGERGYIVCPLIDPSDVLGVKSVEEVLKEMRSLFPRAEFLGLHGRMSADEKQGAMEWLKEKGGRGLVATTVVEVGVDVQEATFIVIEGAERFGLAELHQLRGRVGRGALPGTCFLVPSEMSGATSRLKFLEHETSGFKIAEMDMKLRGHGSLVGHHQSGYVPMFRVASLDDVATLEAAKLAAVKTLEAGDLAPEVRAEMDLSYTVHAA